MTSTYSTSDSPRVAAASTVAYIDVVGHHHALAALALAADPHRTLTVLMRTTAELRDEAYGWVIDAFGYTADAAEHIADSTDEAVAAAIDRYYDGGIPAFLAASTPLF